MSANERAPCFEKLGGWATARLVARFVMLRPLPEETSRYRARLQEVAYGDCYPPTEALRAFLEHEEDHAPACYNRLRGREDIVKYLYARVFLQEPYSLVWDSAASDAPQSNYLLLGACLGGRLVACLAAVPVL